jgi:hypothetical protein
LVFVYLFGFWHAVMATLASTDQEAPLRAKRASAPSKKLTDTSNTARPELSAHSEAIALKRAEDAKRLAAQALADSESDQQLEQEQNPTPSGTESLSVNVAKRSRNQSNPSSDAEDNSSNTESVPEKPKSQCYTLILYYTTEINFLLQKKSLAKNQKP